MFRESLRIVDVERMLRRTEALYRAERKTTTPCFHRSAAVLEGILKEDGFVGVDKIYFPADGKTCYQDKRMPLAWDATVGRLTLLNGGGLGSLNAKIVSEKSVNGVVADFEKEPYQLVKGSVAVAPGGVKARILTEAQFLAGGDARGALVLLEPNTWPRKNMLTPILDRGGLGFVTDFLSNRFDTPDAVQWVNACTENNNWLVDLETRPFVGFSVSPRAGTALRGLAAAGALEALVECDGRRYVDSVPLVTATVPGESDKEFWLLAHMYEPFATDDANGVAAAVELARYFLKRGKRPAYTIRLVCGFEYYGFAAYTDFRGDLKGRVVGALNTDSIAAMPGSYVRANRAASGLPSALNTALEMLVSGLKGVDGAPRIALSEHGEYYDDLFVSDPSVGVPAAGLGQKFDGDVFWHNSLEDMEHIDRQLYHASVSAACAYLRILLDPTEAFLRRAEADYAAYKRAEAEFVAKPAPASRWRDFAARVVPARAVRGFPYDLDRIPQELRDLAGDCSYCSLANAVANMDGRKNLAQLLREAEFETGETFDETTLASYVRTVLVDGDYGYFANRIEGDIGKADILAALRDCGIREGDVVAVHSDLFAFGHIAGGAATVVSAFREAVGEKGSVVFPTFTDAVRLCGDVNCSWDYRPFDRLGRRFRRELGSLPLEFLRLEPAAPRGSHPLYSWTGFGAFAQKAPERTLSALKSCGGKFVYFGVEPGRDDFTYPNGDVAVVGVRQADGSTKTLAVSRDEREEGRFPRAGDSARRVRLGMGEVCVVDFE